MKALRNLMGSVLASIVVSAQSASFECGSAKTEVERLICSDAALSKLDEDLHDAYASALQRSARTAVQREQFRWLSKRNTCRTVECLLEVYTGRIRQLDESKENQRNTRGAWTSELALDKALCTALRARLNRYDRDNAAGCVYSVLASFPDFMPEQWQELDPAQHRDLLEKALQYSNEGPHRYFSSRTESERQSLETASRLEADELIAEGIHLRLLRAKVLDHYYVAGAPVRAPAGTQSVLETYFPRTGGDNNRCPGKPTPKEPPGSTFLFTTDLRSPDPRVDPGTFSVLSASHMMLYRGRPVFIDFDAVSGDRGAGLAFICTFSFNPTR